MHGLVALAGYLTFVVYGSLVPLDYHALPFATAWQRFQDIPFLQLGVGSRADWVANGVLYAPLGFLAARAFEPVLGRGAASALALPFCAAVAVAVEFAQLWFPPRTVSQNDLIAEFVGSALGIVLATALRGWGARIREALAVSGRPKLLEHALEVYLAGYLLLGFFPYDLLLSLGELRDKAASDLWGWWVAGTGRPAWIVTLLLAVEAALAVPIGGWLAGRPTGPTPRLTRAVAIGAGLGLAIEVGQFLIASGVSQGASVVARAAGVAAGVWLRRVVRDRGAQAVRAGLRGLVWPAAPAYLLLVMAVGGWFKAPWHGLDGAAATWAKLRLLPFYYHYYTSEAVALASLGSVALMVLPIAAAGWVRGWPARAVLAATAVTVAVVECGKLFVPGLHPDPTNLLIALAANAVALRVAAALGRPAAAAHLATSANATAHSAPLTIRSALNGLA